MLTHRGSSSPDEAALGPPLLPPTLPVNTDGMRSHSTDSESRSRSKHLSSSVTEKQQQQQQQQQHQAETEDGLPTLSTLRSFLTIDQAPSLDPEGSHALQKKKEAGHDTNHDSSPYGTVRARKTPIFSGLMAPFSIVLEVPGLTSNWYAKIDQDGLVIRFIDNPVVLTAFLAVSLGAATIANLAIVCRFLEVLPPRVSIALAITGFALHDLINIVALAVFGGIYGPKNDGLSLSASYWMVCASTITSALVTVSLVVDYLRTTDFKNAGSGLTQLQKGLVLAGMALLLYLSLGSLIFVFLIDIDFITALYFSCATVLTVGFGDVVPPSPGGKILVILYAPVGIVLVAMVVSSARNTILETFQESLIQRRKEHRQKVAQRRAAQSDYKRQDRALKRMLTRTRTFNFGPVAVVHSDGGGDDFANTFARMEKSADNTSNKENGCPATSINADDVYGASSASSGDKAGAAQSMQEFGMVDVGSTGDPELQVQIAALQQSLLVQKQTTEEDFRHFEKHAQVEARYAAKVKIMLAASITMAFWLLGALAFKFAERWSYGGALWFCFISMITIGYGDYHPATQLGRAIFVIWGLLGVAVLTILLAVVQDAFGSIFHRLLVGSTTRLFDRAEQRARKRRRKKHQRRSSATSAQDEDGAPVLARSSSHGHRSDTKRSTQNRKSRDFAKECEHDTVQGRERHAVSPSHLHDSPRSDSQGEFSTEQPDAGESEQSLRWTPLGRQPHMHRFPTRVNTLPPIDTDGATLKYGRFFRTSLASDEVPFMVEDTLVSQPQKLAHAALVTYQHSMQVLQLHELQIMKTMVEVPALRNFYNARQRTNSLSASSPANANTVRSSQTALTSSAVLESEMNENIAIKKLYSGIEQTGNKDHEKIARLVVANLEFETHLRKLLADISGLKSHVEEEFVPGAAATSTGFDTATDARPPAISRRISL